MTGAPATSRLLSRVLRHRPAEVGLVLDPGGWVRVETLLTALAAHGRPTDRAELERVVGDGDKRRFEIVDDRIRATHGHSVPVDLGLAPATPPDLLFHGTVAAALPGIETDGLLPRGRTHVHLSADAETARTVGARRGDPVVLTVDAAAMHAAGHVFHRSTAVWLTAAVPAEFVRCAGGSRG